MTLPTFLSTWPDGSIVLTDHRISLNDVLHFFHQGDSPEMLHARFPTVALPTFYKVIAFYLENQAEVETYLERERAAVAAQRSAAPQGPSLEELRRRREGQRLAPGA